MENRQSRLWCGLYALLHPKKRWKTGWEEKGRFVGNFFPFLQFETQFPRKGGYFKNTCKISVLHHRSFPQAQGKVVEDLTFSMKQAFYRGETGCAKDVDILGI